MARSESLTPSVPHQSHSSGTVHSSNPSSRSAFKQRSRYLSSQLIPFVSNRLLPRRHHHPTTSAYCSPNLTNPQPNPPLPSRAREDHSRAGFMRGRAPRRACRGGRGRISQGPITRAGGAFPPSLSLFQNFFRGRASGCLLEGG